MISSLSTGLVISITVPFGSWIGVRQRNVCFHSGYKLWVQFQRLGVVNTVEFNVLVSTLQ